MLDQSPFHVTTIHHRNAPLTVRESVALDTMAIGAMLASASAEGRAVVPLSTCNRTECYAWGEDVAADGASLRSAGGEHLSGRHAARHLFAVAAGLESQLVGETEILGQVRLAWLRARAAGATNESVNLIFSHALAAGRLVRRDTWLGRHPLSVMAAGMRRLLADGRPERLVLLGAGQVAHGVAHELATHGISSVTIVCRRPGAAAPLVEGKAGWQIAGWPDLAATVAGADVVIAATAARTPVLLPSHAGGALRAVLDLGMPRNVDPAVGAIAGVHLISLEDLRPPACAEGSPQLADAWHIVEAELDRLDEALTARARAPRLAALHREGARIAEEEAVRAISELDGLDESSRARIRQLADRVARRVLYPASRAIREA